MIKKLLFISLVALLSTPLYVFADERLDNMVIFGDSLSDTGNLASVIGDFPSPPYFSNRVSNGPNAMELAAAELNLPLATSFHLIGPIQGYNFSVAGARASRQEPIDLLIQINAFLANNGGVLPENSLYVMFVGGNDIRAARVSDPQTAAQIVSDSVSALSAQIQTLIQLGAKNWFVVLAPDIGQIPESAMLAQATGNPTIPAYATALYQEFNLAYVQELSAIEEQYDIELEMFDLAQALTDVVNNATALGFTNTTEACFFSSQAQFNTSCNFGANFDQFIYFDEIHPTARVHKIISAQMVEAMRELVDDDDDDDEEEEADEEEEEKKKKKNKDRD